MCKSCGATISQFTSSCRRTAGRELLPPHLCSPLAARKPPCGRHGFRLPPHLIEGWNIQQSRERELRHFLVRRHWVTCSSSALQGRNRKGRVGLGGSGADCTCAPVLAVADRNRKDCRFGGSGTLDCAIGWRCSRIRTSRRRSHSCDSTGVN